MPPIRLAAAVFALCAGPVFGCELQPPLDLADAPLATMIFAGRILSYDPVALPDNPAVITHATATFAVTDAIVGDPPTTVTILLLDNLTGVPDAWPWDDSVIVATLPPGTSDTAWAVYHNPLPDLPVLLHPTCGTPFVAPDDAATRAAIRAALDAR